MSTSALMTDLQRSRGPGEKRWGETRSLLNLMVAVRQGVIRDARVIAEVDALHRRWPGAQADRDRAVELAEQERVA